MMLQHFASGLSIFSGVLAVFLCVLLILQLAVHKQLARNHLDEFRYHVIVRSLFYLWSMRTDGLSYESTNRIMTLRCSLN